MALDLSSPAIISREALIFLGKVSTWLAKEPTMKLAWGEFFVSKVEVSCEGEVLGTFISDDPDWFYEPAPVALAKI